MDEKIIAVKIHDLDNVAAVFSDVPKGDTVEVVDKKGNRFDVTVKDDVPFGHKFAIASIKKGEQITKYGEEIGVASMDIETGDYVHVHNLESTRGRGDLNK